MATVTACSTDSAVIVTACGETLWVATIELLRCIDEVMMMVLIAISCALSPLR